MSWPTLSAHDAPADITLLLEGTFPMVRGGVSSWVNQMIRGLPDWRFAIVFLGARESLYNGIVYERPTNVVHLETHFLMDPIAGIGRLRPRRGNRRAFAVSDDLHRALGQGDGEQLATCMQALTPLLETRRGVTHADFLYSRCAWEQIVTAYREHCTDPSFIDYFWALRNMHGPLFPLARIARDLPPSRMLHAVSTGYAGYLGALARYMHGTPFMLTEHGIYTKERMIELMAGESVVTGQDMLAHGFTNDVSYSKKLWTRFFDGLGRIGYLAADPITTLYEGNRRRQVADGAPPERTRVIPNGIALGHYQRLRETTANNEAPIIALIGRVTSIKDIKTFIRAMRVVVTHVPEAKGWIVGPTGEDPEYASECRDLIEQLALGETVEFLGFRSVPEVLSQIRVMALTSISEAQPLVVLEAMAAGIPAVCTDVGSCRELLYGLGAGRDAPREPAKCAGRIVPIADAAAVGAAIRALLDDQAEWSRARSAGIARADAEHSEGLMLDRYRELYNATMSPACERTPAIGDRSPAADDGLSASGGR